MKIPLAKLKAMLLFFGTYTDGRMLGKTKLMKLFYFVDFGHLKQYGSPVTYDTYYHLDHGPTPTVIMDLVNEVGDDFDNAILADTISIKEQEGTPLKRIIPVRQFTENDTKHFSATELQVMKGMAQRFATASAKEIETASHKEIPWIATQLPEKIPYTLAARDRDSTVSEEEIRLLLKIVGFENG